MVGVSPQTGSLRNSLVRVVLKHRDPGRVDLVSPSQARVAGLDVYRALADQPHAPDLAHVESDVG